MKKIFLFTSALLVSATMMAQLVGWSAVELSNETAAGTSTINHLYTNEQGDIFFLGNSASNGKKPTISFDGITLDAAPYRVNMSQTNMNVVFGKLSGTDASTQWFGASDRGAFTDYVALPTADGKLLMALTAYHTDSNHLADNQVMGFNLQMADGTTASGAIEEEYAPLIGTKVLPVRFGCIVEVSDNGFKFLKNFYQLKGQNAGFTFVDMATDGTNVYVLAQLAPGIVIGEDTIKANVEKGSLAILKFDSKWNLTGTIISEGLASKTIGLLKYADGKLYYAGNLATTKGSSFSWGGKTVEAANTGNSMVWATLSTDLQCELLALVDACKLDGKGGNITVYDEVISGTNAYLTGFQSGSIILSETDTLKGSATNSAFLLSMDLTTGKAVKATRLNATAITSGSSLFMHNDSVYMYAYNWAEKDGRVALYTYDAQLNAGDTIALVNAAGQEATNSAVLTKYGTLAYSFRTKGNATFSADVTQTYAGDNAFRGVLAVQQLFENPEQAIDNTFAPAQKAEKFIRNGQLYIRRGEHIFNALGQQL